MIAGILTRLLTWLGSRGIRLIVREIADALEDAEKERDYQEAVVEKARREAEAADLAGQIATKARIDDAQKTAPDDFDAIRQRLLDRAARARAAEAAKAADKR